MVSYLLVRPLHDRTGTVLDTEAIEWYLLSENTCYKNPSVSISETNTLKPKIIYATPLVNVLHYMVFQQVTFLYVEVPACSSS